MYKLICVDLDGTLLDGKQQISEKNKQAINDAIDAGLEVAIVSGRPNCFTIRIIEQINDKMGHITFNGAYYRIANKTKTFPIEQSVLKRLAKIAMDNNMTVYFKNKNLSLCTKEDRGYLDYDKYKDQIPKRDIMDMHYHVDLVDYLEHNKMEVLKIMFLVDEREIFDKVATQIYEDTKGLHVFEYPHFLEMSSNHTSKGLAIEDVCKELNIDLSQVVCIGDNLNDVPMLKVAGLSVAMGNAVEEVKEMCDVITTSNEENGVAHAIYTHVLNK